MGSEEVAVGGVHLWLVLWKAFRAIEKYALKSIEASGMCQSDFAVLEALLHKGPLPVSVLGSKVLLTSGSITTAVDRLEKRGLVERVNDSGDRRARIVHLTVEGRKLIRRLFAQHERAMDRAASTLDATQRATLIDLLKTLGKSMV
jgi:MarR family 2-MHQ and catechol resistance regulon transcriptional repressor